MVGDVRSSWKASAGGVREARTSRPIRAWHQWCQLRTLPVDDQASLAISSSRGYFYYGYPILISQQKSIPQKSDFVNTIIQKMTLLIDIHLFLAKKKWRTIQLSGLSRLNGYNSSEIHKCY